MADTDDQEFDKAFEGFGDDPAQVTPPTPPADPAKEEPKKDDATPPTDPPKEEPPASTEPAKKPEENAQPPQVTETPPATPEAPQPLTKSDVEQVVSNLLNTERNSSKEMETATKDVLDAYYPEGLSNTLVDEKSGRELRTPADVVEASGGEMSTEQAAQWLMNEQFKLDKQVDTIRTQAKEIAETTTNFKRDSISVLQKYDPLFKAYPMLQQKAFDLMMKQVKVDKERGVILQAPDVMDLYDTYLEPYQQAYEFSTQQSATNPTPPPGGQPPKPTADDRMDITGDGGTTEPNDPNNFAQQVSKELAKGM